MSRRVSFSFAIASLLATACVFERPGQLVDEDVTIRVAETQQALTVPGLRPVPCVDGQSVWEGSRVEALFADMLAGCVVTHPDTGAGGIIVGTDRFFRRIDSFMGNTLNRLSVDTGDRWEDWITARGTPEYNCDEQTGDASVAGVDIARHPVPWAYPGDVFTNSYVRFPSIAYCVSHSLRQVVPGSASGAGLLLGESEQLAILELIRQFSQRAALEFGVLATLIALPLDQFDTQMRVRQTWDWGQGLGGDELTELSNDWVGAVELHSTVAEELLNLYARSRSANAASGATGSTRADANWGTQSWYQRLLASAYGGDPLVTSGDRAPWEYWYTPSPSNRFDLSKGKPWPTSEQPYVSQELHEPQVFELFRLAQEHESVVLVEDDLAVDTCGVAIDVDASADHLYKTVESELREQHCYREDTSDACPSAPVWPTSEFGAERYLLFDLFRITPDHATVVARYLAQAVGMDSAAAAACEESSQVGALRFVGDLTRFDNDKISLGSGPELGARSLSTIAPTFAARASTRFPSALELPSLSYINRGVSGLPGFCSFGDCQNSVSLPRRTMGSVAALSALRAMLIETLTYQTTYDGTPQRGTGNGRMLMRPVLQLLGLIDASVGQHSVVIRPYLDPTSTFAEVLKSEDGDFIWQVWVTAPVDDPWWSNACADGGQDCSVMSAVVGLRGEHGRMLAENPDGSVFGKTLWDEAVAAFNAGYGGWAAPVALPLPPTAARNQWVASMLISPDESFPEVEPLTFVAIRLEQPVDETDFVVSYRLLGSNVHIDPDEEKHGLYLAYGGALGGFVERQATPLSSNPTRPAFDGFDLRSDWAPPLTAELMGGTPGEPSFRQLLDLADVAAQEAAGSVATALEGLHAQTADEATQAVAAARSTAAYVEAEQKLCGTAADHCDITYREWSAPLREIMYPIECSALHLAPSDRAPMWINGLMTSELESQKVDA